MISAKLFKAAELWAIGGNRSIDLKIDNQQILGPETDYSLWVYSYSIRIGVFVTKESELPTDAHLKALKREQAEAVLSQLN